MTDADLLFLRDHGTQSVVITCNTRDGFDGVTISPDGVIQFCFHHGEHSLVDANFTLLYAASEAAVRPRPR